MEPRSFLIPTTAALSLAVTPGCLAIVGEWELVSATFEGVTSEYPYTRVQTYGNTTYQNTWTGTLWIDPDLTGDLGWTYDYSVNGEHQGSGTFYSDAFASHVSFREFTLSLEEIPELSCLVLDRTMTCELLRDDGGLVFSRSEP